MTRAELRRRLQYGPGIRAERLFESGLLTVAILGGQLPFAIAVCALMVLQSISSIFAPVAVVTALVWPARKTRRVGDLCFDLSGVRGATATSAVFMTGACVAWAMGAEVAGRILLTLPFASLVLSSTIGFCAGCWFFVMIRDAVVGRRPGGSCVTGSADFALEERFTRQPELRPPA